MENNCGCCKVEINVVKCVMTALEKIKDMFVLALSSLDDPSCEPTNVASDDATDSDRPRQAYTFRRNPIASSALRMFCTSQPRPDDRRPDQDVMRLLPGEVGLRGDRATFHLGQDADQPVPVAGNGRPAGPVYYHDTRPGTSGEAQQPAAEPATAAHPQQQQSKRTMQVLPSLPASATNPAVGPVTGLPVDDNENVFALQLSKRYGEQDEKACLQIEVRLPRPLDRQRADTDTQYLETDLPVAEAVPVPRRRPMNKKRPFTRRKKKGHAKRFGTKKSKK